MKKNLISIDGTGKCPRCERTFTADEFPKHRCNTLDDDVVYLPVEYCIPLEKDGQKSFMAKGLEDGKIYFLEIPKYLKTGIRRNLTEGKSRRRLDRTQFMLSDMTIPCVISSAIMKLSSEKLGDHARRTINLI